MKNGKSSAAAQEIFYEEDNWTPHERKFLAGMDRRRKEMEAHILSLAAHRLVKGRGVIYRKRFIHPQDLQPAYDFLQELRQYIGAHICRDDTPLCWARELSKMHQEYSAFLSIQEIVIFYSGAAAEEI